MAQKLRDRIGTAAQAASANPTLLAGEIGLESDTRRLFVGDGATAKASLLPWNNRPLMAAKTASYTILDADADVFEFSDASADGIFTLPTLADNFGRIIELHNVDPTYKATLDGEGAETIDGNLTMVLPSQYNYIRVRGGTATWHVLELKANYDTGWVANSDWTNAELTATHNLGVNLSDLIIKFFVSTDGAEANAFEIGYGHNGASNHIGFSYLAIDTASFKVQTGSTGLLYVSDTGTAVLLDVESYYYKVKVRRTA